jgi:predicted nucleic acid-binding Zn ribbon protein
MPAKQLAITMDEELVSRVKKAAERSRDGNVSAWLSDAASAQLRYEEARRVLDELVAEQGPVSEAAVAEVRRQWPED